VRKISALTAEEQLKEESLCRNQFHQLYDEGEFIGEVKYTYYILNTNHFFK
jgi:hypothetical protein